MVSRVYSLIKATRMHIFGKSARYTASITWDWNMNGRMSEWMKKRGKHNALNAPWSVYEVHLASWMRPVKIR